VKLAAQGQISFKDFFRWLRENGYLNSASGLMECDRAVAQDCNGTWFLSLSLVLRVYSRSAGLGLIEWADCWEFRVIFPKGFYIFDLPSGLLLGSSIPELGNAINGDTALNPLFASVLIPSF